MQGRRLLWRIGFVSFVLASLMGCQNSRRDDGGSEGSASDGSSGSGVGGSPQNGPATLTVDKAFLTRFVGQRTAAQGNTFLVLDATLTNVSVMPPLPAASSLFTLKTADSLVYVP